MHIQLSKRAHSQNAARGLSTACSPAPPPPLYPAAHRYDPLYGLVMVNSRSNRPVLLIWKIASRALNDALRISPVYTSVLRFQEHWNHILYTHIYMCVHTYIYVCKLIYVCVDQFFYRHLHIDIILRCVCMRRERVCARVFVWLRLRVCESVCVCEGERVCGFVCVFMCVCVCLYVCVCEYVFVHIRTWSYTCTYVQINIYLYMCICTYTYI